MKINKEKFTEVLNKHWDKLLDSKKYYNYVINKDAYSMLDAKQDYICRVWAKLDSYEVTDNSEENLLGFIREGFRLNLMDYNRPSAQAKLTIEKEDVDGFTVENFMDTYSEYLKLLNKKETIIIDTFLQENNLTKASLLLNMSRRTYTRRLNETLAKLKELINRDNGIR